jgi:diguanylate cyclase (GGDEF)-like protein
MFNLFSSRETHPQTEMASSALNSIQLDEEKSKLNLALHSLLEIVPQSYDGQENIKRLCETITGATSHVRFIWIGFCEEGAEIVSPYCAFGACAAEANDWHLPGSCFKYGGTYAQASQESVGELNELNSLFAPWHKNMDACTVNSALAIPLRCEKAESKLKGLLVFYADDVDYFSRMGVAPFQALSYVAEIIWQTSNLMQLLTQTTQLDALTGLMNRRKTMHELGKAVDRANEKNESLSVMICRIDDFDKINDTHGWLAADAILSSFAKLITSRLRPQDKVGRWTNIEFLFVLPRTDITHAELFAQSLQAYVMRHPIMEGRHPIRLNLSVSVTSYTRESNGLEELVQQANQNLWRVVRASESELHS